MNIYQIFVVFVLLVSNSLKAQYFTYSQFYNSPIQLNPALAGSVEGKTRLHFNNRLQNANSFFSRVSTSVSADMYFKKLSGGLAIMINNEVLNRVTSINNSVSLSYAYHHQFNDKFKLQIGLQSGWSQNYFDWSKIFFGGTIDPNTGFIISTLPPIINVTSNRWSRKSFFDFAAGVALVSDHLFGGISAKHLSRPASSHFDAQSNLPILFLMHAGAKLDLDEEFSLIPNALFSSQQGFNSITIGVNTLYKVFSLGLYARDRTFLILSAGIEKSKFRIQYSYNFFLNPQLIYTSSKIHEMSLMFQF